MVLCSTLEFRPCPSEGMAAWANRLPASGCSNEAIVADRLDEQLHEACGGILPYCLPPCHLAGGIHWFQDALVDADVAIDIMMWQNGGICGLDHWNFVMHSVDAALTCDPYGYYVSQWCPELKVLPDDFIHKPWKCPSSVLRRAGVVLGQNYPEHIVVDLEEWRAQSLQDVTLMRKCFSEYVCQQTDCDLVPSLRRMPWAVGMT
ncbi:hypothetical protein SRHO_G00084650 [Serrasalmus rhombeus]